MGALLLGGLIDGQPLHSADEERVTEAPLSPLRPATILEIVLRSDKLTTLLLLIAFPAISWAWIIVMARDMYGPMNGASAWMMTSSWDASHVFLLWAMWAVMMTAMMLPPAAPMICVYATAMRRRQDGRGWFQAYGRVFGHVGPLQRSRDGAAACARRLAGGLAHDGADEPKARRGPAMPRGCLSIHTTEARMPVALPVAAWLPHGALARGTGR